MNQWRMNQSNLQHRIFTLRYLIFWCNYEKDKRRQDERCVTLCLTIYGYRVRDYYSASPTRSSLQGQSQSKPLDQGLPCLFLGTIATRLGNDHRYGQISRSRAAAGAGFSTITSHQAEGRTTPDKHPVDQHQ